MSISLHPDTPEGRTLAAPPAAAEQTREDHRGECHPQPDRPDPGVLRIRRQAPAHFPQAAAGWQ